MKVLHYINFVAIFLFLVGIVVLEDTLVSNALTTAQNNTYEIEALIEDKDSLRDSQVVNLVDNIEYEWISYENKLAYLVNHKSIQEIGMAIATLKACIVIDDIDDFRINLQLIDLYCNEYLHFMGASLHNVL